MVRLLIDTYRTAEHQPGRLRGKLTSQEIKKYVAICLKPGKSTVVPFKRNRRLIAFFLVLFIFESEQVCVKIFAICLNDTVFAHCFCHG